MTRVDELDKSGEPWSRQEMISRSGAGRISDSDALTLKLSSIGCSAGDPLSGGMLEAQNLDSVARNKLGRGLRIRRRRTHRGTPRTD